MAGKLYRQVEVERLVDEAHESGSMEAGWVSILADMMTLLLTFFIMLLALAAPEREKYIDALSEVGSAFGGKSLVEMHAEIKEKLGKESDAKKYLKQIVQDNNLMKQVHITSDARGITIYSEGDFFFKSGTAELMEPTKNFLKRVSKVIKKTEGQVLIEGHTDDQPIHSALYPTNWELSSARAASVSRYFIEQQQVAPRRFIISGYAEFKPRYTVTPENRARNRRVEIVLMKKR